MWSFFYVLLSLNFLSFVILQKKKISTKMQPGFLLKKQEGEDEDVHEERRFRAHMEEALKKSLMDEVDDSFNPPAERGTRRRVDRTIERSKRSGKERVIVAGDGKEVTTGTVFEALMMMTMMTTMMMMMVMMMQR